mmetsp:Transcript_3474/g.8738  ORF Transcript_3474/g.8738 Transcript_3474/m.8738 type:complete len:400 (-) Transcript_3474:10-1209(-)
MHRSFPVMDLQGALSFAGDPRSCATPPRTSPTPAASAPPSTFRSPMACSSAASPRASPSAAASVRLVALSTQSSQTTRPRRREGRRHSPPSRAPHAQRVHLRRTHRQQRWQGTPLRSSSQAGDRSPRAHLQPRQAQSHRHSAPSRLFFSRSSPLAARTSAACCACGRAAVARAAMPSSGPPRAVPRPLPRVRVCPRHSPCSRPPCRCARLRRCFACPVPRRPWGPRSASVPSPCAPPPCSWMPRRMTFPSASRAPRPPAPPACGRSSSCPLRTASSNAEQQCSVGSACPCHSKRRLQLGPRRVTARRGACSHRDTSRAATVENSAPRRPCRDRAAQRQLGETHRWTAQMMPRASGASLRRQRPLGSSRTMRTSKAEAYEGVWTRPSRPASQSKPRRRAP